MTSFSTASNPSPTTPSPLRSVFTRASFSISITICRLFTLSLSLQSFFFSGDSKPLVQHERLIASSIFSEFGFLFLYVNSFIPVFDFGFLKLNSFIHVFESLVLCFFLMLFLFHNFFVECVHLCNLYS